jgi:hypothetical protein
MRRGRRSGSRVTRLESPQAGRFFAAAIASSCVALGSLVAADAPSADTIDFEAEIRPLLVAKCGDCHGPDTQESSLRLDVRHRAFKGGDFGPVIQAGKAAESELVKRITHADPDHAMPPDEPLSADEIALLTRWIDAGAEWPEADADRIARETDRDPRLDHWAWQPVKRPDVPAARSGWPAGNEIDRFLQQTLAEKQLAPAPEADRRTLIRRLSFDLLGLPPAPEEVEAFVADESPDAYEQLVDRLLASPHYGERWARHWLDIAHYADTHGFERDQLRPQRRRGFYGLALGIVARRAAESGHDAEATACLAALERALAAEGSDLRAGYDGLLGGLFVARGTEALDWVRERGLLGAETRAGDARHTLAALRFAWEYLADEVPRDEIAAAAAGLLANPAVAADTAVDLARWQHWESVAEVAALWDRLGRDDPLVRRAVAGYLTACPLASAKRHAAAIAATDSDRWAAAVAATGLPPRAAD